MATNFLEDDDDDIFITQNVFSQHQSDSDSSFEFEKSCLDVDDVREVYAPPIEDISEGESPDEIEEHVIRREMAVLSVAEDLHVSTEEVECAMLHAVDVRDMPTLGGPTIVAVERFKYEGKDIWPRGNSFSKIGKNISI